MESQNDHDHYNYMRDAAWAKSILDLHRNDVNIARESLWEYIPVGGPGGLIDQNQTPPSMNAYRTLIKLLTGDQDQWTLLAGT